jgi:heptosyltransferase II
MQILVRLPNWLGDMVMSIPFLEQLKKEYPEASVSVIVKKELEPLLQYFPPISGKFIFSKPEYTGIGGVYRFGKTIRNKNKFDLYFSLPDSFSAALMGWACGAVQRIGYSNEARSIFLTKSFKKNTSQHRALQYLDLLQKFTCKQYSTGSLHFSNITGVSKAGSIIVNIHSEAISRRLPKEKAIGIITQLQKSTDTPIILIGGPNDIAYTKEVVNALPNNSTIINKAGTTSLAELPQLMSNASVMLSTDSGPAHIANAVGLPLVVLFGAGNEKSTAPFNEQKRTIIRLGQLPCEPCVKNTCQFGLPKCLEQLDENKISAAVLNYLK